MNYSEEVEVVAKFENGSNFMTVLTSTETADNNSNASDNKQTNATMDPDAANNPLREFDFLNPMWNVGFTFSVVVGTLGNAIVLWIVLGKNEMSYEVRLKSTLLAGYRLN